MPHRHLTRIVHLLIVVTVLLGLCPLSAPVPTVRAEDPPPE